MSEQLIYTLNRSGTGIIAGYGVYSTSSGMDASDRSEIEVKCSIYTPPESIDSLGCNADAISKMPISLAYLKLASGKRCITQQIYTGADYDNPNRPGNFISNSVVDNDFEGYPIEYFGSDKFTTDMHYEQMDVTKVPPALPNIELTKGDSINLKSISNFVLDCDKGFFKHFVYTMLSVVSEAKQRMFISSGYENPKWIAAATMAFPVDLAKQISFSTFDGRPDRNVNKIVGIFDKDSIPSNIRNIIDPDRYSSNYSDEKFDRYLDSCYGDTNMRSEFFDFLKKIDLNTVDLGIVDAYNLMWIIKAGSASETSVNKAVNALKKYYTKLTDEEIYTVFKALDGRYDDDIIGFFDKNVFPRTSDEFLVKTYNEIIISYRFASMSDLKDLQDIKSNVVKYCDGVDYCLRNDLCELLQSVAGLYYTADHYLKHKEHLDTVSKILNVDDCRISAIVADTPMAVNIICNCPELPELFISGVKGETLLNVGTMRDEYIREILDGCLDRNVLYTQSILRKSLVRKDALGIIRHYLSVSVKSSSKDQYAYGICAYSDFCSKHNMSFIDIFNDLDKNATLADKECVKKVIIDFVKSIHLNDVNACKLCSTVKKKYGSYADCFRRDGVDYVQVAEIAYSISKNSFNSHLNGLDKLSKEAYDEFLQMCFSDIETNRIDMMKLSQKMSVFQKEPDIAVAWVWRNKVFTMGDKMNYDTVAKYFDISCSLNVSDGVLKMMTDCLSNKEQNKVIKVLERNYPQTVGRVDDVINGRIAPKSAHAQSAHQASNGGRQMSDLREKEIVPVEEKKGLFGKLFKKKV